jgi:carotenoid cleavage dioxygenase
MWSNTSKFLNGIYEPLANEYRVESLRVEGRIPDDLNGTLYRNGSNAKYEPSNVEDFHWFDGDGMVHAFHVGDGRVTYRNRWVQTEGLEVEDDEGRALYNGIYTNSGVAQLPLPLGAPPFKLVANVNVVEVAGKVYAVQESGDHWYQIDPVSLDVVGTFDFDGQVHAALTAHPHVDPKTGEIIFYILDSDNRAIEFCTATADGKLVASHRVEIDAPAWVHDIMFTDEFYIVMLGPILWHNTLKDYTPRGHTSWGFDADLGARIVVVNRHTGKAQSIQDDSYQINHFLNAYQVGSTIVVDGTVAEVTPPTRPIVVGDFFPFPISAEPSPFSAPMVWRWTIDTAKGSVRHERVGDYSAEFPRPNETLLGSRHRYGYFAASHSPKSKMAGFNCLVKEDYEGKPSSFQYLSGDADMSPGEPVFVPRENSAFEDDGYVLAVWWDPRRNASELVIHDAHDFSGAPLARVKLDHHVPLGFHGNWVPDSPAQT